MSRTSGERGQADFGLSRRAVLGRMGVGALALGAGASGAGALLDGCGTSARATKRGAGRLRVAFVAPLTGADARFASGDTWVVDRVRASAPYAGGLRIARRLYDIDIVVVDSRSDANLVIAAMQGMALAGTVDLVLATSGAETTNAVAGVCASQGIPCVATVVPWELWYGGLGGDTGSPGQAFDFCTMFFFGFRQLQGCFVPMWERAGAGRAVACMYPFDAAGLAFRSGFEPLVRARGYQVVDGGAYDDGTGDYTRMVSLFRSGQCGAYTNASLPADFAGFWRQAAQDGYRPKLATVTNVAQFPADVVALGPMAANIATAAWWAPAMPHVSSLTGESAQALADAYQAETGRAWVQSLGSTYALFEVAMAALRTVSDPHDKQEVAAALHKVSHHGMCGPLDFATGPAPGVAVVEPVGAQWKPGQGKHPFVLEVVDHSLNPAVPVGAPLAPTT